MPDRDSGPSHILRVRGEKIHRNGRVGKGWDWGQGIFKLWRFHKHRTIKSTMGLEYNILLMEEVDG